MIIVNSRLDYSANWNTPDIYLFTGNSYITKNGKLVMGRGAALACRDLFTDCDKQFAFKILTSKYTPNYFVEFIELAPDKLLGAFQVKHNFADNADIELIKKSAKKLKHIATQKPHIKFHMNFPGIGYGGLPFNIVLPIVDKLPNNVILYK